MKSTLEKLEVLKRPFFAILQTSPTQCGLFLCIKSPYWGGEVCRGHELCKFGQLRPSKSAKIHKNQKSEPQNVKNGRFCTSIISKIDFT